MEKNKKNEELQSRREFFKKAAKGALPILGLAIMANVPMISKATESEYCTCSGDCKGACSGSCVSSCRVGCGGTCKGTCSYTCDHGCSGSCLNR